MEAAAQSGHCRGSRSGREAAGACTGHDGTAAGAVLLSYGTIVCLAPVCCRWPGSDGGAERGGGG
jgi:hypothetical protein